MPKVSVIVPIYGVEKYIERCADSLFTQTLDDIEFIFVDDCTPDRSMELLYSKIEQHKSHIATKQWIIKTEIMPVNSGIAAVRERGFNLASGDYIIHCDSDDWVQPDIYKLLYDKAVFENADVVLCDYHTTDGFRVLNTVSGCTTTDKTKLVSNILAMVSPWAIWNKLVKRSCYDGVVFPSGSMGEDMCLSTQLLLNANGISYVPQALYNYFYNPNSITNTKNVKHEFNKYKQFCKNVDIVLSAFNEYGLSKEYADPLVALQWKARKNIWRLTYDNNYYRIWKKTYPNITSKLLLNPYVSRKDKLRFFMTFLRIYPRKKDRIG